jgi:Cof subfamily protein (haloacid dehalogenase superfamily)
MAYRLLALDLDGTLLRSDHTIDPRDVAAIAELQAAGITVTIVTGRLHSGAVAAARACAIDGLIACMEGSHLIDLGTGATVAHHPLADADAARWQDAVDTHGLAGFVLDADGIHHDHRGTPYAGYVATWSPNLRVRDPGAPWVQDALATVAIGDPDAVAAAHAALASPSAPLYAVRFPVSAHPGTHAMLARAAGPTKGTALAALCTAAGCTLADAVVVGDWVNDVPMFAVAARAFAMGGSPDDVRATATDQLIASAGAGGGIAEAIRRAWG